MIKLHSGVWRISSGADLGFIKGGRGSKRPTKAGVPRGVRGEAPPENIEILLLRNAFSSILGSKPKGFHYWNLSKLLCRNEKKIDKVDQHLSRSVVVYINKSMDMSWELNSC